MIADLFRAAVDAVARPPVYLRESAVSVIVNESATRGSRGGTVAQPVTFQDYLDLEAQNLVIKRCVDLNAQGTAQGRVSFYRGDEQVDAQHQVVELFSRVNDSMTSRDLIVWTVKHLDYVGNSYWELVRSRRERNAVASLLGIRCRVAATHEMTRDGLTRQWEAAALGALLDEGGPLAEDEVVVRLAMGAYVRAPAGMVLTPVKEVWPLNPSRVTINPGPQGVVGYTYAVGQKSHRFLPDDVLHLRYADPNNDFYGISPLRPAAKLIVSDGLQESADQALLRNGARLSGIVTMDKDAGVSQVKAAVEQWKAAYSGADNAGKTAFLAGGKAYQQIGLSPAEMQSVERRRWNKAQLMQALGVYPVIYGLDPGDTSATRENATVQRKLYFEHTILVRADLIASAITELLLPRIGMAGLEGVRCAFDFSESPLLRELLAAEAVSYAPLISTGAVLPNDVRSLLSGQRPKFAPTPYGDTFFGSLAMVPVGHATEVVDVDVPPMFPAGDEQPLLGPAQEPALLEPAAAGVVQEVAPSDQVLNGAQLAAASAIVQAVADGLLPRASGIGQLMVLFNLTREEAELIMASVGKTFEQEAAAEPSDVSTPSAPSEPSVSGPTAD